MIVNGIVLMSLNRIVDILVNRIKHNIIVNSIVIKSLNRTVDILVNREWIAIIQNGIVSMEVNSLTLAILKDYAALCKSL